MLQICNVQRVSQCLSQVCQAEQVSIHSDKEQKEQTTEIVYLWQSIIEAYEKKGKNKWILDSDCYIDTLLKELVKHELQHDVKCIQLWH